jgi:hypothetical protein
MAYSKANLKSSGDKASPCFGLYYLQYKHISRFLAVAIHKKARKVCSNLDCRNDTQCPCTFFCDTRRGIAD